MGERVVLRELLRRRTESVAASWCDAVLAAYPERAYTAWTRETDPFANPVGHSLRVGTRAVLDVLLEEDVDPAMLRAALADIVRIRAVQQMPPSAAVGFVFRLKGVIRSVLAGELEGPHASAELEELSERVDVAALAAFDVYAEERARIVELRVNELKKNIPWFVGRTRQVDAETALEGPFAPGGAGADGQDRVRE